MAVTIIVMAALGFIAWLIVRAVKGRPIKAHMVSYGVAIIAGVFTYAYFLTLDFPRPIKILVSTFLGIVLIMIGAFLQRRLAARSNKTAK